MTSRPPQVIVVTEARPRWSEMDRALQRALIEDLQRRASMKRTHAKIIASEIVGALDRLVRERKAMTRLERETKAAALIAEADALDAAAHELAAHAGRKEG